MSVAACASISCLVVARVGDIERQPGSYRLLGKSDQRFGMCKVCSNAPEYGQLRSVRARVPFLRGLYSTDDVNLVRIRTLATGADLARWYFWGVGSQHVDEDRASQVS